MLKKNELEDLVKRRRNIQDLELDSYIRIKNEILELLIDIKNDKFELLTIDRIEKLHQDLKLNKIKTELSLDFELAKYNLYSNQISNYDIEIRKKLTNYIINSTNEFKELTKKINLSKELLENRNSINNTIQDYFTKTKIIKLNRKELNLLFDKDTNDLESILSSGRLIRENKSDPLNDEFEFKFNKSSSFRLSTIELEKRINLQIAECEIITKEVEESKNKWKNATLKLVTLLDSIEHEIQL